MFPKRGKANGKAKAKKRPRAARANQKSGPLMRRTRFLSSGKTFVPRRNLDGGMLGSVRPRTSGLSVPLNQGVLKRRFFGMRFASAPPHDEFPEGGLRIAGTLPAFYDGAFTEQKDTYYGLMNTQGAAMINPSGAYITGSTSLFNSNSPLAIFAQYFRRFRFRKVSLDVTSEVSPGAVLQSGGAGLVVQVAHEPDPMTAWSNSVAGTQDSAVVSGNCTRFSAWANDMLCPVITERSANPADELFYVTLAGEVLSSAGDASIRQTCQGAVTAYGSILNGTAALTISKVLVEFVIDLYGFTNLVAGDVDITKRRFGSEKKDRKESQPDADLTEFVDITPNSNRLQIRPDMVVDPSLLRSAPPSLQSVRVSSKK